MYLIGNWFLIVSNQNRNGETIMTKKRNIAIVTIVVLTALLLAAPWSVIADDDDDGAPRHCDLQGVWTFRLPRGPAGEEGMLGVEVFSGEKHGTSTSVFKTINPDPTLGGLFPDATTRSEFEARWRRTGPNTWDYTCIGYGTTGMHEFGFGEIVWIMVFTGTATATDCDTLVIPGRADIYSGRDNPDYVFPWGQPFPLSDQDTDPRDGVPDADEEPILSGNFEVIEARLPMLQGE
jgi:hypothetical protein